MTEKQLLIVDLHFSLAKLYGSDVVSSMLCTLETLILKKITLTMFLLNKR